MSDIYNKISKSIEFKIDKWFGKNRTLKQRIYNIVAIHLIILLFISSIMTLFFQKNKETTIITFVFLIIQVILFIICNYKKKVKICGILSIIFMDMFLFLLANFTIIQGIIGIYIIMILVYISLLFNGKIRITFLSIEIMYSLFLLIYDANNIVNKTILYDSMLHSIIMLIYIIYMSMSIGVSLLTIIKLYNNENEKLKNINEKIKKVAITDSLTGAWNRNHMESYLQNCISNEKFPLSIIMLDIDYFKRVNDNYGHIVGDNILKQFVKLTQEIVGKSGIVTRYGGEEFLIILPTSNIEHSYEIAEKIRKESKKSLKINFERVTISGGIAEYKQNQSIPKFIETADKKLYEAKENGRNRILF